jgi:hypothetical protein
MIGAVLGLVLAGVVALVISFATAGRSTGNGCVYATIPGAVGTVELYRCGDAARELCSTAGRPGAYSPFAVSVIAAECRKIGLHVSGSGG